MNKSSIIHEAATKLCNDRPATKVQELQKRSATDKQL